MNEKVKGIGRRLLLALLLLVPVFAVVVKTTGQDGSVNDAGSSEQWEYMVVSSPSGTNLSPSGNSRMRKEPSGAFGREAFVLEQQMDKVGARGWELVAITGAASETIFYFKRRK